MLKRLKTNLAAPVAHATAYKTPMAHQVAVVDSTRYMFEAVANSETNVGATSLPRHDNIKRYGGGKPIETSFLIAPVIILTNRQTKERVQIAFQDIIPHPMFEAVAKI